MTNDALLNYIAAPFLLENQCSRSYFLLTNRFLLKMMAFADPISQESVSGCCRKKVVDRRNGDEEKNNTGEKIPEL
jgi:hypothetical protein